MTKTILLSLSICLIAVASTFAQNPFFEKWETPFSTPPFEKIKIEHYKPAFEEGIKQQEQQVLDIANMSAEPTFENTLEALEASGALLTKVSNVFYNLNSSSTNTEMQEIAKFVAPLTSKLNDDIYLNDKLFQRIKTIYNQKDDSNLSTEQQMLLDRYYKDFVRGGANLSEDKKARFREINERLSLLSLNFGENVLKETNKFELVLSDEKDLAGFPQNVLNAAQEAAKESGYEGKYLFTLHKPSLIPFLQYSEIRDYREKMLKGYINRGNNNDELDNKNILSEMVKLRIERAKLLGYKTHAHYILEKNMAQEPSQVYDLLNQLWSAALPVAQNEAKLLQEMIEKDGKNFKLEAWDWWYYAEKLKKEKYALDDEILRPYFKLENVRQGAFDVATKLFGITFTERKDIQTYHSEVNVFEVKEADGTHIGILYTDYFPRASKRGGAWMSSFRKQQNLGGKTTPVIVNVCNFTKPTGDTPSLLTFEEVTTLFHEFGHALHGLLSNCEYYMLSGTSVPRDFVELPSQIMENWAGEPAVMKSYAKHFKTGESIPDELIEKIKNASHFNQGFATVEYLAASFLDMDWHTLAEAKDFDVTDFENKSMDKINLMSEIVVRYKSPYFQHIFAGGYSSGYYSYIWAEVLDADAFQFFKETDIFDRKKGVGFRENILAKGGTELPMDLYKRFRGSEPKIEALLERRGLN